ncbi:MAG: ABC transporter ATP-binding protein [Cytophagales bacterium]|nr:MAG: ABC transporter ATP-binding protein [Cytophagales bacterium]TAF60480.1 MAG: ABC transporter ATP-binding protein [Cytophagales bacterium]
MYNKNAPNILEVKNLTVEFSNSRKVTKAVDSVSFEVKQGETLGIVGESGSGKTVSSLSLMQLIQTPPGRIASGEIWFQSALYSNAEHPEGKVNLLNLPRKDIREIRGKEISMIFQEPMTSLNPVYTCGAQVVETILKHEKTSNDTKFSKMTYDKAKEITMAMFNTVHLPSPERIFNAYPHEISGGQKQRVMIAMSLVCNPSLLIADEPTTALDVTVQASILETINELKALSNMSVMFISHDLNVIAEVADRVLVMWKGQIVEQGFVEDVFTNPQHPYTKGLLACRPRLDAKLKVLPTVADFMGSDTQKQKFQSVGQAILFNYESEDELREQYEQSLKREPILQIKNLKTYFAQEKSLWGKVKSYVRAVDDVSLTVYKGETVGLVGESGCGKSTLGRSVLRLVTPMSGQILFEGKDVLSMTSAELRAFRRQVQIIFQDPYASLNPRMTIGESILEPMRVHDVGASDTERRNMALELLHNVNLTEEYYERYPHQLSGGQRQRVCIARTLGIKPKFIICDESVSALDVSVQAQVLNLLNQLKQKYDLTYIFISHDLAVVKFIASRVFVMNKGKIDEEAFSEDLYSKPQSDYTKKLIESIPTGNFESKRKALIKAKIQHSSSNPPL